MGRFGFAFVMTLVCGASGHGQHQPFIVATGPEGEVVTSFKRNGDTYSLTGEDVIEFAEGDGVLRVETVVSDTLHEPTGELKVVFEPTEIFETGELFNQPLDPLFTGDLNAILQECVLHRGDDGIGNWKPKMVIQRLSEAKRDLVAPEVPIPRI